MRPAEGLEGQGDSYVSTHAKATPTGPDQRQAGSLGRIFRGVLAGRAAAPGTKGSGAPSGRLGTLALALAAVVALLALCAASASATVTHEEEGFSPIDGSATGVSLNELWSISIDEETGNVFVPNPGPGGGPGEYIGTELAILGGEGGLPEEVASPYAIGGLEFSGNTTYAVAYDNVEASPKHGTLYVYDKTSEADERLKEYMLDAGTETFVLQTGAGNEPELPGVDEGPSAGIDKDGNLWVGSAFAKAIYKVDTSGTVAKYDVGSIKFINQVAVDSAGNVYPASNTGIYKCVPNGSDELTAEGCTHFGPETYALGVAVDREHNHVYAAYYQPERRIVEYDIASGGIISEFGAGQVNGSVAVDESTGRIYAADGAREGGGVVRVYGAAVVVPTVKATAATEVAGTKATLNGSVNAEGTPVEECFIEWGATTAYGHKEACEGEVPPDASPHPVSLKVSGLTPNGATYHYRVVAVNEFGTAQSDDKTMTTAGTVITEPATGVGTTAATLNGSVGPEGSEVLDCQLEYKRSTDFELTEVPCDPNASEIEADFTTHQVSAQLSELQPNATYVFRLKATVQEGSEEVTRYGDTLSFTTTGPPQIAEVRAVDATQDSVTLEAKIDPSGFGTSYRFEWGPTDSYGTRVPASFEPFIGSGNEPVRVTAELSGLSAASVYHYRVVASSTLGGTTTVASADQTLETLNSCNLPDGRCLEMVSPKDLGPVAAPGRFLASRELHRQASDVPGAVGYTIEAGLPDATRSAEVLYKSVRGPDGWTSKQMSPGLETENRINRNNAIPSENLALSDDLDCGLLVSNQLLTDDPVAKTMVELGGRNLYVRNPDGTYDLVSEYPPTNPEVFAGYNNYIAYGLSADCKRVLFTSHLRFPGLGDSDLYEWTEAGGLKNAAYVPSGGGEEALAPTAGAGSMNSVSDDGSRAFFQAKRLSGKVGGEVGKVGVFVRENGESRDVSASETGTPNTGASYVGATPDGSRVYFTANAGLTAETSASGTDLYEYDLEAEELRDLSVFPAGDADAAGLVGVADDGSHVYFVTRTQLLPGRGPTTAENQASGTFSVYDSSGASLRFVGVVDGLLYNTTAEFANRTARVSPDGRYLLFESAVDFAGYDSDGRREAYLYDSRDTSTPIKCVSCRQDGQAPGHPDLETVLARSGPSERLAVPQSLVIRDGEPLVFFVSIEALAHGAVQNEWNLYEWSHDQVFHIATEPGTGDEGEAPGHEVSFVGASADGTDLYFFDAKALNWENPDERYATWDARVGGGFPEPPSPEPCDPTSEGACQGQGSGNPSNPSAASRNFQGQGNVKETGNGASRCTSAARQAQRLSARAKKLRRNARRVNRNGHRARAMKLNRKARNLAKRARSHSNQAKRCRKRLRAGNDGRAGK